MTCVPGAGTIWLLPSVDLRLASSSRGLALSTAP